MPVITNRKTKQSFTVTDEQLDEAEKINPNFKKVFSYDRVKVPDEVLKIQDARKKQAALAKLKPKGE